MIRTPRPFVAILLAIALALPGAASATDPNPLGDAITLADGRVLAPMPGSMLAPSVQAEMLAQHGGPELADAEAGLKGAATAAASDALVTGVGGVAGPGGVLPNGLGHEVLGFLPYWDVDPAVTSRLRLDLMSTIAYFSIGATSTGDLMKTTSSGSPTTGWAGWTSSTLTSLMNRAHQRGVRVVPTITMHAWSYDYSAMTALLNSPSNRARLVANVVSTVRDRRADGVNIDFEPVPASLRSPFTGFVREVKAGLVSANVGSYVTVDTMAGAAAWSTGYDVAALTGAGAADAIMVMAYDFSYSGSARAGGVAPYESGYLYAAADSMRDHLGVVPAGRMIWGVPYYGRSWNTRYTSLNSAVRSPAASVALPYYRSDSTGANAKTVATTYGRRWDAIGQVPYVVYKGSDGGWRQLYYDDPASVGMKYDMILRNGLAGAGIWALGMDAGTGDLWSVIESHFLERVGRASGLERYGTAAAVSSGAYGIGVPVAYIATGGNFPDALAAGPLAGREGGPILLSLQGRIPEATATELLRLKPDRITVLGGRGAISDAVVSSLRGYATSGVVTRIAGIDRYGTAAAASASLFASGAPVAYLVNGAAFADALGGGVAAGRKGGPILLTRTSSLPGSTRIEIARLSPSRIVVLGGSSVISAQVIAQLHAAVPGAVVSRLSGWDRYETAVAVSRATTTPGVRVVYLATGEAFPDGVSGSAPAVRDDGPLLLTRTARLPSNVLAELIRLNPARVVILGGTAAVSAAIASQLRALWD